jgi:hypothetical protein
MDELPESARRLLTALVDIEEQAIEVAREGGCKCDQPLPEPFAERSYPAARFDYAKSVGKKFDEIEWELVHQPGCPMDGQKGVGYARHRPEHA